MSSTQIDTMLWHTQTRRAGDTGRQGRKPGKETTMTTKEMIRSEYAKVWARDQKMVDYCAGKVAAVAILNDGLVYPVDKQKIETRFCFGESGYDYDDALKAAANARKSESHFKTENMRSYREKIDALTEILNGNSDYMLAIRPRAYCTQTADCKLCNVEFVKLWEVLDACGGSACRWDLFDRVLTIRGLERRIATPKEVEAILEAYKSAAAKHEKKVDAYLKRYGTSKVHAWTYWRDA